MNKVFLDKPGINIDALDFSQKIEKHSINIAGHATSVTLEPLFWELLKQIAAIEKKALRTLIEKIDDGRTHNLSCAIRIYIMTFFLEKFSKNP